LEFLLEQALVVLVSVVKSIVILAAPPPRGIAKVAKFKEE
jgi:hypothetical protein